MAQTATRTGIGQMPVAVRFAVVEMSAFTWELWIAEEHRAVNCPDVGVPSYLLVALMDSRRPGRMLLTPISAGIPGFRSVERARLPLSVMMVSPEIL